MKILLYLCHYLGINVRKLSMKVKNDTNLAIHIRQIQVADDYLWDTITLKDNSRKAAAASGKIDDQ